MNKTYKVNVATEIKAIARERLGRPKSGQVIVPKTKRKPKHRKREDED